MKHLAVASCLLCQITTAQAGDTTTVTLSTEDTHWQSLQYSNIPSNHLSQSDAGLKIDINGSASPLIYVFEEPKLLSSVNLRGTLSDLPQIPKGLQQGSTGADDFALRLGMVIAGDKQLNFAQKLIAADWVKTLYSLAPSGTGIDHVHFLNLANAPKPDWQQRTHPNSKGLFQETIIAEAEQSGEFEMSYQFEHATPVVAFWISSDGDDTDSTYTLELHQLTYTQADASLATAQ